MKVIGILIAVSATVGALALFSCSSSDSPGDSQGGGGQNVAGASGSGAAAAAGGSGGNAGGGAGGTHAGGSSGTGPAGSSGTGPAGSGGTGPAGSGGVADGGGTGGTSIPTNALYLDQYGIKGDCSDETAALKSAFEHVVSASMDAVVFPANKVICINDYVETPEHIELVGNGCTIKLMDMTTMDHEQGFFYIHDGCYCHDLIFDGNMWNQSYDGGPPGYPAATNGVCVESNVRFEHNEVKNVGAYSVFTYLSDNAVIHNNVIHDSWQYGIGTSGSGETVFEMNVQITNNTIYNCEEVGIKLRGEDGARVSGNTVTIPQYGSKGSGDIPNPIGIHLYSSDGPNKNVTITGNTVTGIADSVWNQGIGSDAGFGNVNIKVTDNILNNVQNGIDVQYSDRVITGNVISYYISCITGPGSGNTSSDNTCTPL
jgi:parallel beta-helix repeat protein